MAASTGGHDTWTLKKPHVLQHKAALAEATAKVSNEQQFPPFKPLASPYAAQVDAQRVSPVECLLSRWAVGSSSILPRATLNAKRPMSNGR